MSTRATMTKSSRSASAQPRRQKKILILAPFGSFRNTLSAKILDAGHSLDVASNMRDLWLKLADYPDLLILDEDMHGGEARGICEMVKAHRRYRNIPVIICYMPKHQNDDGLSYMGHSAEALLAKTTGNRHLSDTINAWLAVRH